MFIWSILKETREPERERERVSERGRASERARESELTRQFRALERLWSRDFARVIEGITLDSACKICLRNEATFRFKRRTLERLHRLPSPATSPRNISKFFPASNRSPKESSFRHESSTLTSLFSRCVLVLDITYVRIDVPKYFFHEYDPSIVLETTPNLGSINGNVVTGNYSTRIESRARFKTKIVDPTKFH